MVNRKPKVNPNPKQSKANTQYNATTKTLVGIKPKTLVDTDTGECITVDEITKIHYGAKQFWKCYLMDFLAILGIIDNRQVDIFIYIVQNTNPQNNLFIGTYKRIATDTGASEATIARIMAKLVTNNFVRKIQNGVYAINPNILAKGDEKKRQILLTYYNTETGKAESGTTTVVSRTKRPAIPPTEAELESQGQQKLIE